MGKELKKIMCMWFAVWRKASAYERTECLFILSDLLQILGFFFISVSVRILTPVTFFLYLLSYSQKCLHSMPRVIIYPYIILLNLYNVLCKRADHSKIHPKIPKEIKK